MSKPSYDLKLDRAEKHLVELEGEITRYVDRHPYAVSPRVEGKRKVYVFAFTEQPPEGLAVVAGDFLYNVHSALDHLAGCLVRSKDRSRCAFPIFWKGVWGPARYCEHPERLKDRERWRTYTRNMPSEARAIIEANQPDDLGRNVDNTHALAMLRRLRNTDAHRKLLLVAATLRNPVGVCETDDGAVGIMQDSSFGPDDGLQHEAPVAGIPSNAVNVQITGSPEVVIRLRPNEPGGYRLEALRPLLLDGSRRLAAALRPFDRLN